jgi:hypothetical protein
MSQTEQSNGNRTRDELSAEALDADKAERKDLAVLGERPTPSSCVFARGGHATTSLAEARTATSGSTASTNPTACPLAAAGAGPRWPTRSSSNA